MIVTVSFNLKEVGIGNLVVSKKTKYYFGLHTFIVFLSSKNTIFNINYFKKRVQQLTGLLIARSHRALTETSCFNENIFF